MKKKKPTNQQANKKPRKPQTNKREVLGSILLPRALKTLENDIQTLVLIPEEETHATGFLRAGP